MAELQAAGAPVALVKQARRCKRLEARLERIGVLVARATEAGDDKRLEELTEEREMRAAELSFRARKIKMAAKDYPELLADKAPAATAEE